ncbi:MAG: PEP-CTERM sorting domain-containing protein [Phycisphaerae bacterium]
MKTLITILALCLIVAVGTVQANLSNVRPVGFGSSSELSLQQVLNNITTSGFVDATNDQINAAIFTNQGSGGAVATFVIEIAGSADSNTFGIYDYFDPSKKAQVFSGLDTAGGQKLISFMANGDIKVNFITVATFNPTVQFGFYLDGPKGTFYSEDSLNGGNAQAVILRGKGAEIQMPGFNPGIFSSDEYIVAFENAPFATADRDYQDLVVHVESISPVVPAPAALALGVIGLGFIGWVKRRFA